MKIRTGFVSNSSSSSFLIVYKDKDEFFKFKLFKGYDTFIKDLNDADSEQAINHIKTIVDIDLHHLYNKLENFVFLNFSDDVFDLLKTAKVPYEEYRKIEEKILDLGKDYHEKIFKEHPEVKDVCLNAYENYYLFLNSEQNEFIRECQQEFMNNYYNDTFQEELDKDIKNLASKIYNNLKEKGYNFGSIRYEDDTYEGDYMEHGFMPFLSNNPEQKYQIFTQSEH